MNGSMSEWFVTVSAFASHATQYLTAAALIGSRKVDARQLVTRTVPLGELPEVLRHAKEGHDLKVVVDPWAD